MANRPRHRIHPNNKGKEWDGKKPRWAWNISGCRELKDYIENPTKSMTGFSERGYTAEFLHDIPLDEQVCDLPKDQHKLCSKLSTLRMKCLTFIIICTAPASLAGVRHGCIWCGHAA